MQKSAEAFRTISEVAEDLDVPKHVLRFWEGKFSQLRPMKRGGGRRYYRPGDVDLLRGIRQLLYGDGYTIRGVQKLLRDNGVEYVKNYWREAAQIGQSSQQKVIPDLASETARRAVEGSAVRPKGQGKRGRPRKQHAGDDDMVVQSAETLRMALSELEMCRRLLTLSAK